VAFSSEQIREAFDAVGRRQSAVIEARAVTLYPAPTGFDENAKMFRREPVRVLSLLPTQIVYSGSSVTYWAASAGATAAAPVAAGAQKPESTPGWAPVEAPLRKVAHWAEVPTEAFSDFSSFEALITGEMTAGVISGENSQLLSGTGVAPQLTGMLAASGIQVYAPGTAEARALSLLKGQTMLRTGSAFSEATAIVLNPVDWELVRRWSSTTNELIVGDATDVAPETLWGVPVIVTTGMTAGTALVADLAGSVVGFLREAPKVLLDPFSASTKNMVRVIAESRIGLGIVYPSGICKVTFNGLV